MKKLLIVLFALVMVLPLQAQNNVITYTASEKLEETTDWYSDGLYVDAFGVSILSHDFSGTTGIITFSGDVTSIGKYAFYDCSGLTSITIPNSVTSIRIEAFYGCSGLTSITIPNSVTSIGNDAFSYCSGLTSITIPESVTSIGSSAFYDCSGLTSITIPNSVTSIGALAFYGCSGLTSITIPESVTSIGSSAFSGCTGLTSIVVESGNLKYDSRNNCNAIIETATNTLIVGCMNTSIPNSVTSIGGSAFEGCSGLTSITIPNSVTSIGEWAFYRCSGLTSITIPNSVTSIGSYAFDRCSSLTSVSIPNSVTSIGEWAFGNCSSLTSIDIPNSVTSIGDRAFYSCFGLTSIDIPNSVTSIGERAFFGCSGLTSIEIPNSVTSIRDYAFAGCSGLTSITCHAEVPPICGENVFYNVPRSIPLCVPASSIPLYQAAEQWNEFAIQSLIVEIDSIAPDTVNLTWLPVDSAAIYQLHIYSNQVTLDTTLIILANPNAGGSQLQSAPSPYRQHRIVLDDGVGTLVVVVFDDNSGATSNQPFIVSVSTSLSNRIDIQYDMTVLDVTNNIIRQEPGLFTLNEGASLYDALDVVSFSGLPSSSSCFDLRGNRYPLSQWSSLPVGIYVIREGGATKKILKTR